MQKARKRGKELKVEMKGLKEKEKSPCYNIE
jgi:hypothetical protein